MEQDNYIEKIKNRSNGWILPAALLASCGVIAVPAIVAHGNYEQDLDEKFNADERLLTKSEMRIANDLWIEYNSPTNVVRNG